MGYIWIIIHFLFYTTFYLWDAHPSNVETITWLGTFQIGSVVMSNLDETKPWLINWRGTPPIVRIWYLNGTFPTKEPRSVSITHESNWGISYGCQLNYETCDAPQLDIVQLIPLILNIIWVTSRREVSIVHYQRKFRKKLLSYERFDFLTHYLNHYINSTLHHLDHRNHLNHHITSIKTPLQASIHFKITQLNSMVCTRFKPCHVIPWFISWRAIQSIPFRQPTGAWQPLLTQCQATPNCNIISLYPHKNYQYNISIIISLSPLHPL